ncbi:hypothetical protein N7510_001629 [Penicillium lagena]|uniref:uncharacterized protein n=1 Tax=Penicillium lagena TaxID=94218 RepID=UPI00253FD671|nr:uncharacterized protein N7510_001629 [Penicillium lagena]KAJ5625320.1 hypothetical protein N7510_001629 [Penicillium lagena]
MSANGPRPGFLGNLSQDQETKLQQLWRVLLKATELPAGDSAPAAGAEDAASTTEPPQRRLSRISRTQSNLSEKNSPTAQSAYQQRVLAVLKEFGIQNAETKAVQKALSAITPTELRQGVLNLLKHDHPDSMLLRFLRARKWDISKSFVMMMDATVWRVKEMHVDDDVMAKGELHALKQTENTSNPSEKKAGTDFLSQMRMGKAYVHGTDKLGRPIVVIRVRLHKPGAQSEEALERYIVHVIESVRLTLSPPVETACVLFDMTGFGLGNMEYPPVKFILKCFEANYPESLGIMLIHNAPWIFSGIWKIIRGWMDPDIAAKVDFTNNVNDLAKHIERDHIVKEVGGNEDWEYKYIEPSPEENEKMNDTTTRDALISERQQIGEEFLTATSTWVEAAKSKNSDEVKNAASQRAFLAERLRVNHWKLDPYTRARLCLDREGVIQEGGKIDYYPKGDDKEANGEAGVESKTLEVQHLESLNGNATEAPAS